MHIGIAVAAHGVATLVVRHQVDYVRLFRLRDKRRNCSQWGDKEESGEGMHVKFYCHSQDLDFEIDLRRFTILKCIDCGEGRYCCRRTITIVILGVALIIIGLFFL